MNSNPRKRSRGAATQPRPQQRHGTSKPRASTRPHATGPRERSRQSQSPLPTTTLDVVDFAVTRAIELKSLREASKQVTGNRRVYQQLSWHARRRSMSHSSHRMPARLRLAHAAQLQKQGAVKPPGPRGKARLRKYRQKARFLQAIRRLRSANERWLETHIWHAKRFRMGNVGGRKVAEACNDRGYRSAYRAATRGCVMCDVSYFEVVEIIGAMQRVKEVLRQCMSFEDGRKVTTDPVTSGIRWVTNVVIMESGSAIAPCDLLWRSSTPNVWLFTCPEAISAIMKTLSVEGVTVRRLACPPNRFRIIGPRSGPILGSVLTSSTEEMKFVTRARDSRCLPSGCVFAGTTGDPRKSFPPKTVGKKVSQVGECGDAREVFKTVFESPLWDGATRESLRERVAVKGKDNGGDVPFIVLQRSIPPGYDILLPPGWGSVFWISFMYANSARAIGSSEHGLLLLEHLQPIFPEDYPDSKVAEKLLRQTEQELKEGYSRRPKGKRVDFGRYRIESPWYPDLLSVSRNEIGQGREKRLKIGEIRVARGRARLGQLLGGFAWVLGDARGGRQRRGTAGKVEGAAKHEKHRKPVQGGDGTVDIELCTSFARVVIRAGRGVPQRCGVICEALETDLQSREGVKENFGVGGCCRRVVGYIVRGGYSIAEGIGIGVGFVAISALRRVLERTQSTRKKGSGKVQVLFRNPSSLFYKGAELRVLEA